MGAITPRPIGTNFSSAQRGPSNGATTTTPIDVAVVGGGPAGAATALALARAGYTVTVLERSRYDAFRIGETLPPAVKRPLMELGVWDQFLATGTLESPGIVSAWGRPDPYDNDFIVNPDGPGWHVDRRGFDAMLARRPADGGRKSRLASPRSPRCAAIRLAGIWRPSRGAFLSRCMRGYSLTPPAGPHRRPGNSPDTGSYSTASWG